MSATQTTDLHVVLIDEDVHIAQIAVRRYLTKVRAKYRTSAAQGQDRYAGGLQDRYERCLDLYERLGGNPDDIPALTDPVQPQDGDSTC